MNRKTLPTCKEVQYMSQRMNPPKATSIDLIFAVYFQVNLFLDILINFVSSQEF